MAAPVTPFNDAETETVPEATPVVSPRLAPAMPEFEELHVTWLVKSRADPSLKVPVAVNCCDPPTEIEAVEGVTAMETRVALLTVSVAFPVCPAKTAEM